MYRKAKTLRKIKIDKSDAKLIASMLLTDVKDSTPVRSHHVNELKSPSRHRFRPIGYRSKLKISIRRILDMTFRSSKVRCGPYINPAKPLVFAGPEPSMFQSGKYVAGNTPMVKHGSTYPRWALLNAARLVVMGDSTFSDYYWKKRDEGKHHNVALSHIERKLAR
jgi:hypothetical protein